MEHSSYLYVNGNRKEVSSSSSSNTSSNGTPTHSSYKGSVSLSSPSSDELSTCGDVTSPSFSNQIVASDRVIDNQQTSIFEPKIERIYSNPVNQNSVYSVARPSTFNQNLFQENDYNSSYNNPHSMNAHNFATKESKSLPFQNAAIEKQNQFFANPNTPTSHSLSQNNSNKNAINSSTSAHSISPSITNYPILSPGSSDIKRTPLSTTQSKMNLSAPLTTATDTLPRLMKEVQISNSIQQAQMVGAHQPYLGMPQKDSLQNPSSSKVLTPSQFFPTVSQPPIANTLQSHSAVASMQSSPYVSTGATIAPSQNTPVYPNVPLYPNAPGSFKHDSSAGMNHNFNVNSNTNPSGVPTKYPQELRNAGSAPHQQGFAYPSKTNLPYPMKPSSDRNGYENATLSSYRAQYGQSTAPHFDNRYMAQPYGNMYSADNVSRQFDGLSVTKQGFHAARGIETCDLLRIKNVLPKEKIMAPCIPLPPETLSDNNCHPEVFRCTLTKIPETRNLLDKSRLPLGILLHPFRDLTQLSVIQCSTIVRCRSCRTYINPFVYFIDNRHWKCNLCFRANDLPDDFRYNPLTKLNDDPLRRPEVKNATVEFIASSEYMVRPPQRAVYLFILDVSRIATQIGYLPTVCEILKQNLSKLPGDSRTSVGFITVDSTVRFYELGENLNQPRELIITDVDDIFIPHPENLLVNLCEQMEMIKTLLTLIPEKFRESYDTNCSLGAALQAAHKLMAPTGGRVTVFISCLPNYGPGALKPREDPNQRANNKNLNLNPATDFYKKLALDCNGVHVAVDLFIINAQFIDLATLSGISQVSGGCMYHFPLYNFKNTDDVQKFTKSFERYLTRKIGFEAVMRMRCSKGLSIHSFHGNYFVRTTDLLALPNINPEAGFGMQISIDENLCDLQSVSFQAALLYTSSKGERRIRVHTLCLPVTNNLHDLLFSADQQCIAGLLAKMAVDRTLQTSVADAREAFVNAICDIFNSYKIVSSCQTGTLSAPINLAVFPLYILGLMKSVAFRLTANTRTDDRIYSMYQMKCIPLDKLIQIIYPDLYSLHNLSEQPRKEIDNIIVAIPPILHLSAEYIDSTGVYLLDEGDSITIFICQHLSPHLCRNLLGYSQFNLIPDYLDAFPVIQTEENELANAFINYVQSRKPYPVIVSVLKDTSQTRQKFFERLVDDKSEIGVSYYEFLQTISKQMSS